MSAVDNGGPVFPHVGSNFNHDYGERETVTTEPGMNLRDYFAAKVMAVYMMPDPTSGAWSREADFDHIAATAYKAADAMLKARAQ